MYTNDDINVLFMDFNTAAIDYIGGNDRIYVEVS
jgi:hypothetical protein